MKGYEVHIAILLATAIAMGTGFGLTLTKTTTSDLWRVKLVGPLLLAASACVTAPYVADAVIANSPVVQMAYFLALVLFGFPAFFSGFFTYALTRPDPAQEVYEEFIAAHPHARVEPPLKRPWFRWMDPNRKPFRHQREHSATGMIRRVEASMP